MDSRRASMSAGPASAARTSTAILPATSASPTRSSGPDWGAPRGTTWRRRSVSIVVFGHQVPMGFAVVPFAFIVLILVALSMVSAIVLLGGALRLRPTESIRESVAVEPPQSLEAILRG